MLGSPPGEPGGGITGITPRPFGCAEMPGSTSGGGQITPLDRDNSSLKLALPVVSPGGTAKPPVLAWQPKFGVDEMGGGAVRSGCCADAFVTASSWPPRSSKVAWLPPDVVIEKTVGAPCCSAVGDSRRERGKPAPERRGPRNPNCDQVFIGRRATH